APAPPADAPVASIMPGAPYKGLVPYTESDSAVFFGRVAEREIVGANLVAARLTILYGASGVGKTSLLRAGVIAWLRSTALLQVAELGAPDAVPVYFASWSSDPLTAFQDAARDAVRDILGDRLGHVALPPGDLVGALRTLTDAAGCELLVVLDQFEEYFLYESAHDEPGAFASQFVAAVGDPTLRVNFLVSLREDALARLDVFKGRIPSLFDNYLRVDHLGLDAARRAIEGPLEVFNRTRAAESERVSIEPQLVEAVIGQLQSGRVSMLGPQGERVGTRTYSAGGVVEPPYLQLVLTRLWEEERRQGGRVLRLATLQRLGGAERIVRTHLDRVMRSLPGVVRRNAARMFRFLVTPSGSKVAYGADDLAYFTGMTSPGVTEVARQLASTSRRILRPVQSGSGETLYEVFHDVLGPAVLDWRRRYLKRRRWVRRGVWGALTAALLVWSAYAEFDLVLDQGVDSAESLSAREHSLVRAASLVGGEDWLSPSNEVMILSGHMREASESIATVRLVPGRTYLVAAACDDSCSDISLDLRLPADADLWRPTAPRPASPALTVRVRTDSSYSIVARMNRCDFPTCAYTITIMRR
ncbi:MAG TPA: hypothetical protein VGE02_12420, partial [Gemmatimonadales bacterium]